MKTEPISGTIVNNRYEIIRLLGQGGFGAVYLARDSRLGNVVALKENVGGRADQFMEEARILAKLRHPNLPRVSDHFVEPNGTQYLVMDFIEGEDLAAVFQRQGALPESRVLVWYDQILQAVEYLHGRGVIHRDIKPANIRIDPTGQAVLVDFGIAKVFQTGQATMSGARSMGSAGFAAPEQYRGGTDRRSDIYSLGATLYALLTGKPPPDAPALEYGTAALTPPRKLVPALSQRSERAVLRAMAIQPGERFLSAEEMRRALERTGALHETPLPGYRRWIPLAIAALCVLVLAFALLRFGPLGSFLASPTLVPTSVALETSPPSTPPPQTLPAATPVVVIIPATTTSVPSTVTPVPVTPTAALAPPSPAPSQVPTSAPTAIPTAAVPTAAPTTAVPTATRVNPTSTPAPSPTVAIRYPPVALREPKNGQAVQGESATLEWTDLPLQQPGDYLELRIRQASSPTWQKTLPVSGGKATLSIRDLFDYGDYVWSVLALDAQQQIVSQAGEERKIVWQPKGAPSSSGSGGSDGSAPPPPPPPR